MTNALKVAYGLFLRWAKDECLQHSQKRFSTNTLSCSVRLRQYPDLKGKSPQRHSGDEVARSFLPK